MPRFIASTSRWPQPEQTLHGMAHHVQEQLLGYLIGALDDSERRRVEWRLQTDPQWQAELAAVRESLQPLRLAQRTYAPPAGLASRTCQKVALLAAPAVEPIAQAWAYQHRAPWRARRMSPAVVPPSSTASWSWVDLTVAASILVALSLLIFPAVQKNRDHARMMACQGNLRQLGLGVAQLRQAHPELPFAGLGGDAPVSLQSNAPLVLAAVTPSGGPPAWDPRSAQASLDVPVLWLAAPRPGHRGFSDSAWGPNVLYGDGRVTFVAAEPERPFGGDWSAEPVSLMAVPISLDR